MAKKQEPVDDLLDALVWMRRKAKKHEAVDDLIDALVKMRREAKKKAKATPKPKRKKRVSRK
jgi:ClpP class serine protease